MTPRLVECTKCRAPLPPAGYNRAEPQRCPACRAALLVEVFPAALRPTARGVAAEAVLVEGEASCFYHPTKKATVPCSRCGRFLCAVCDVDLAGEHVCPGCLEAGKKKGQLAQLENERTTYDSLALAVAVYPLIIAWFTIIGAPIALYLAIRHWNAPPSLTRRGRWRFIVAIIIALLELLAWTGVIIAITRSARPR